jgi:hypothetical protein
VGDELGVVAVCDVHDAGPDALAAGIAPARVQPSATMTTGRRTTDGGTPLPPDATNGASISGRHMPKGLALQRTTMASSQAAPNGSGRQVVAEDEIDHRGPDALHATIAGATAS